MRMLTWFKINAIEAWFLLRVGLAVSLVGFLAVYQFRPETLPDEAAVFIFVPVAVAYVVTRLLMALTTRVPAAIPRQREFGLRVKFISWCALVIVLSAAIGIPSFVVYDIVGIDWAVKFAQRLLFVESSAMVATVLLVGTNVLSAVPSACKFFVQMSVRHPDKTCTVR